MVEGALSARDLDGQWVSTAELASVLSADLVAHPVLFPSDLLVMDGDEPKVKTWVVFDRSRSADPDRSDVYTETRRH